MKFAQTLYSNSKFNSKIKCHRKSIDTEHQKIAESYNTPELNYAVQIKDTFFYGPLSKPIQTEIKHCQ